MFHAFPASGHQLRPRYPDIIPVMDEHFSTEPPWETWDCPDGTRPEVHIYIYNIYNTEISKNGGTPKSSILLGFPMINHPALGDPTMGIPAQRHGAPRRTPGDGACAGAKAGWNTMGMGQKFKAHWTDHRFYSIFIYL